MLSSTIFPQFRQSIDNSKNPFENRFDGSEILCLLFYVEEEGGGIGENRGTKGFSGNVIHEFEGYILAGGNNKNINIWSIKNGDYI